MAQSSKGGFVISGLVILLIVVVLGGGAMYLGAVSPPAQANVHHVLKMAQAGSSQNKSALPDLPPVPSSAE